MHAEYFVLIDSSLCHQVVSNLCPLSYYVKKDIKLLSFTYLFLHRDRRILRSK